MDKILSNGNRKANQAQKPYLSPQTKILQQMQKIIQNAKTFIANKPESTNTYEKFNQLQDLTMKLDKIKLPTSNPSAQKTSNLIKDNLVMLKTCEATLRFPIIHADNLKKLDKLLTATSELLYRLSPKTHPALPPKVNRPSLPDIKFQIDHRKEFSEEPIPQFIKRVFRHIKDTVVKNLKIDVTGLTQSEIFELYATKIDQIIDTPDLKHAVMIVKEGKKYVSYILMENTSYEEAKELKLPTFGLKNVIGDGSYGKIFHAIKILEHDKYEDGVVKVQIFKDQEELDKFEQEAAVHEKLSKQRLYILPFYAQFTGKNQKHYQFLKIGKIDLDDFAAKCHYQKNNIDIISQNKVMRHIALDFLKAVDSMHRVPLKKEMFESFTKYLAPGICSTLQRNEYLTKNNFIDKDGYLIKTPSLEDLKKVFKDSAYATHAKDIYNVLQNQQPVFHRDIKPNNALLDENGSLFIIDFGESTTKNTDKQVGTPRFMALEVMKGVTHEFNSASLDKYSLGCTLWAFLFGKLPYQDFLTKKELKYLPLRLDITADRLKKFFEEECEKRNAVGNTLGEKMANLKPLDNEDFLKVLFLKLMNIDPDKRIPIQKVINAIESQKDLLFNNKKEFTDTFKKLFPQEVVNKPKLAEQETESLSDEEEEEGEENDEDYEKDGTQSVGSGNDDDNTLVVQKPTASQQGTPKWKMPV